MLYIVSVLYKWLYMEYSIYLHVGALVMCTNIAGGKKKHPKIFSFLLLPRHVWGTQLYSSQAFRYGQEGCPEPVGSNCAHLVLVFTTSLMFNPFPCLAAW